ncbi:MAG TPA: hypothetical protein PKI66_02945 [Methanobacteriaceae archaeon]|nr:hypothetical protein [Methanobacteriaceae archaeon]
MGFTQVLSTSQVLQAQPGELTPGLNFPIELEDHLNSRELQSHNPRPQLRAD